MRKRRYEIGIETLDPELIKATRRQVYTRTAIIGADTPASPRNLTWTEDDKGQLVLKATLIHGPEFQHKLTLTKADLAALSAAANTYHNRLHRKGEAREESMKGV